MGECRILCSRLYLGNRPPTTDNLSEYYWTGGRASDSQQVAVSGAVSRKLWRRFFIGARGYQRCPQLGLNIGDVAGVRRKVLERGNSKFPRQRVQLQQVGGDRR